MKKILLFLAMAFLTVADQNTSAQCIISDLKVRLVEVNTSTCEVTLDLSWTQEVNVGNKFAYVHMWAEPAYHTPAANWINMYSNAAAYPKKADLVNTLSSFVIMDNHADSPYMGTTYYPDPFYELPQQAGVSVVKVHLDNELLFERMTLQNVKLILPSCTGAQTIRFDVWASQAANGKNVHCASQGAGLVINEVKPIGIISCSIPRQFQVLIRNTGPALDNIKYDVHLDYPPFGIINPTDTVVFESGIITLPANGFYTSPLTGYLPYSNQDPSSGMPLIVEVTVPLRPNTTTARIENGCGVLPVKFESFTARQVKDKIVLNWQTASEQNNKGFEVQRKQAGYDYKAIAFVPSKAVYGNSNLLLEYGYEDRDYLAGAGELYYRIKQVNLDGNSIFSEIRLVKNNAGKLEILVYPNPSTGVVKVILPNGIGPSDIILNDMSGKEIRRWNGVVDRLRLDNLDPGIYMLRVFVKETRETQVKKIIVVR